MVRKERRSDPDTGCGRAGSGQKVKAGPFRNPAGASPVPSAIKRSFPLPMKATVLAISALLLGFQASAQQNIGTENAAIERQAPLPAIEPQPDEPGAAMLTGSLAAQPRLRTTCTA
jgi:hypothetical protein